MTPLERFTSRMHVVATVGDEEVPVASTATPGTAQFGAVA